MTDILKSAIKKIAKPGGFDAPMDRGIVLSVDKNECTCVVQLVSNDSILEDVKIKAIINEDDATQLGLILYPAVDSFVIVGQVDEDNTDVFVVSSTIIESIALDTATALKLLISVDGKLSLNTVLTTFNDGKNGGIPLLNPLTAIILNLQQQVNLLSATFTAHVHPVAGAATGPTATPGPDPITPLIKSSDIENKKIKQ